ncbi:MAG: hypothetical protein E7150_10585 [Bacillus sp. (in: Bacteria)]|nr:hypothetical protein [Bacillus sp. (in: firmicutes)]
MTERLYYSSPRTFKWETEITSSFLKENGVWAITLKATAFYPEGGGQPCDTGTIDGITVLDVYEENDEVYHVVAKRPEKSYVVCEVDQERRLDHTQHHSAQHLLSAVCIELFEAVTESFHLGRDAVSIDLSISSLSDQQMKEIEKKANQYIQENHEIKTYIVTEKQFRQLPLRKRPEITGDIRIVEIAGIDVSACCGTHVQLTGEIGLLKCLKTEKHRGKTRLYFICGMRALADYQQQHHILNTVANHFSTSKEDLPNRIIKLVEDTKALQRDLENVTGELAKLQAAQIIQQQTGLTIAKTFIDKPIKTCEIIAKEILKEHHQLIVFSSLKDKKILLMHNGKLEVHCGNVIKEYARKWNGKGGGNQQKAQAIFQHEADLQEMFQFLSKHLV